MKKALEDAEKEKLGFKEQMKKLALASFFFISQTMFTARIFQAIVFANITRRNGTISRRYQRCLRITNQIKMANNQFLDDFCCAEFLAFYLQKPVYIELCHKIFIHLTMDSHVAISRVTSLDGLYLTGRLERNCRVQI